MDPAVLPFRTEPLTKRCLLVLACLATLLVGLGLSRSLRICTQPCCAGHVKLTASCDLAAARMLDAPSSPG